MTQKEAERGPPARPVRARVRRGSGARRARARSRSSTTSTRDCDPAYGQARRSAAARRRRDLADATRERVRALIARDRRRAVRLLARGRLQVLRVQADLPAPPRAGCPGVRPTPTSSSAILAGSPGPLRIAAGAGTGKTDTLRLAIVELIERGVAARRDPLPHLHRRGDRGDAPPRARRSSAARDGHRRGRDHRPDLPRLRRLDRPRARAAASGSTREPALLDDAREWQLLLEALDHCSLPDLEIEVAPVLRRQRCMTLHEEMQRHMVTIGELRELVPAQPGDDGLPASGWTRCDAIEAYARLKRERNAIDFGDQIGLAVWLLRAASPRCSSGCASRFRYVFLDEYQDTDVAQRELVKLVARRGRARLRGRRRGPGHLRLARRDDLQHGRRSATTSPARAPRRSRSTSARGKRSSTSRTR